MEIPFSKVICEGRELDYVRQVLESGWLTTAGKTAELERRFAERLGMPYACAVNSCTAALHLALEALGVGPGDKVLVPTMTFTATAEVVRYMGADPVFLDVDYETCLLTGAIVAEALERHPDARALIVVHYGGQLAPMRNEGQGIAELCANKGVAVVEDAAHAFPASDRGEQVGTFGDVACFSFYANKTITTGEGGMLVTADEQIAERARVMRLHGIDRDIWKRFTSKSAGWEYDVVAPGFKYNMPDLNAAVGLAQLEQADTFRDERQRCGLFYLEALKDVSELDMPRLRVQPEEHAWHLFPVVLNEKAPMDRNAFIERMKEAGIGTSVHYKPLHRMTYYREQYDLKPDDYPNAERLWKGNVTLPVYPGLENEELEYVAATIRELIHSNTEEGG
jgi:dTDP-4-amino-4,6-dideoxygalactose transaminase